MKTSVWTRDAQLLRRGDGGAVHADPLRLTRARASPRPRRRTVSAARRRRSRAPPRRPARTSCASCARPEREPLGRDVHRLEQVRLPGAVRARDEDEPRLERELEPWVRADVAERDLLHDQLWRSHDQPASRIGMIRYQKASPSALIRPGRSGLMSFSWTPSALTDSSPSRRNSALNPISSGSPV